MESLVIRAGARRDWRAVLQLPHGYSTEMIAKQYKQMALLLHPDKNSHPLAEDAFKLLTIAFQELKNNTANPSRPTPKRENNYHNYKPHTRRQMFWTRCSHCGAQYKYEEIYRNYNVECSNRMCGQVFTASAVQDVESIIID